MAATSGGIWRAMTTCNMGPTGTRGLGGCGRDVAETSLANDGRTEALPMGRIEPVEERGSAAASRAVASQRKGRTSGSRREGWVQRVEWAPGGYVRVQCAGSDAGTRVAKVSGNKRIMILVETLSKLHVRHAHVYQIF
jgi:hypothetical protein